MTIKIIEGDSRQVLREFDSNSIHSVVTDPPYALVSISKRFGKEGAAPAQFGKDGAYRRASAGFMGKQWDTGETAFDPEFWVEVMRVLRPGGHVLAFGGTRTYHRLACAIEDAGFEIRDQIGWLYGSGFPKSHNMEGEWEGWGTALKPAWEPIVVARKALDGTNAANLEKWGVGSLNIDGCRVGEDARTYAPKGTSTNANMIRVPEHRAGTAGAEVTVLGRWPANIIHDGSDDVIKAFPTAPGQMADASTSSSRKTQTVYGEMKRGNGREGEASAASDNDGVVGFKMKPGARRADSGSAARFFYCAKASKTDRNDGLVTPSNHPTVKPTDLMRYLCRLVTPPGGTVLDPFMGSGSTGRGAVLEGFSFVGIEMDPSYFDIADKRIAAAEAQVAPRQAAE